MKIKFICQQCGNCCSHIRGRISREDEEFLKRYAYGKMPLVQLVPLKEMSFPLWDWEAKRFVEYEKEVKINAEIKPSRAILDLNTNKAIIVTYFMDSDSCLFLKNKKCLIYDKKRAYICRLFPFQKGPFLETGEKFDKENMFGSCPALKDILPEIPDDKKEMIKFLDMVFQDNSFLNVIQNDIITEFVNKLIVELLKNKTVRPAMNYPYKFLLKRIDKAEKINLTDFLIEKKIKTKEDINSLIERFDNNIDAIEKINEKIINKNKSIKK